MYSQQLFRKMEMPGVLGVDKENGEFGVFGVVRDAMKDEWKFGDQQDGICGGKG